MTKHARQALTATAKAVVIGTMIGAVGFCLGLLVGFFSRPVQAAYIPEKQEITVGRAEVFEAVPVELEEPEEPAEPEPRYHGSCRITAYCACSVCCGEWANNRPLDEDGDPIVYGAGGEELIPGVSVACSLPYGTKLKIDGLPGTYIVQDRTAEWVQDKYAGMTVDIYMDSHEACYELLSGMPEWMDVYIVEG